MKPRNPIIGFLVSHPNRGIKKHKDKKKAFRVPTARMIREWLEQDRKDVDYGIQK